MKIIKADNYQTWFIENKNNSILIDPWLTNNLQPKDSFFIQRYKSNKSVLTNEQIKTVNAIIITAPFEDHLHIGCLLYTSPSPRDQRGSRMPSSA